MQHLLTPLRDIWSKTSHHPHQPGLHHGCRLLSCLLIEACASSFSKVNLLWRSQYDDGGGGRWHLCCVKLHLSGFGGKFHGSARDFMLLKSPPPSLCKVTDHHQRASWCPLSWDNGNNEHKKSGKGAMALKAALGRRETNACCLHPVSALCLSKSVASCRLRQMGQFEGERKHKTGHPSHHY